MASIKASVNNPSDFFLLNGLDYPKGVYQLKYSNVIKDSAGVIDEDLIQVGLKSKQQDGVTIQAPLVLVSWDDGTSTFGTLDQTIVAITALISA